MPLTEFSRLFPRLPTSILAAVFFLACAGNLPAQEPTSAASPFPTEAERRALFDRVIANQKRNDEAQSMYERLERLEKRKGGANAPPEVKISRSVPAGTGVDRIPVGPDGKPADVAAYRVELEKLERSPLWV